MKKAFEKWQWDYVAGKPIVMDRKDLVEAAFKAGYEACIDDERKYVDHIKNYIKDKP